ncbi:MAG TPA: hypothetical protein VHD87_12975 [Acidimicrobiales bacterium]|nr:hypothetical protein [Acidimicrobiales bacterium]
MATTPDDIEVTVERGGPILTLRIATEPFVVRQILAALDNTEYAHVADAARAELGWTK